MEVVRLDLRKYNLSKDLAQDRLGWRNKIHIASPTWLRQSFDDDAELLMMMVKLFLRNFPLYFFNNHYACGMFLFLNVYNIPSLFTRGLHVLASH